MTSKEEPWLVVGLGNPGAKYDHTRHNVGFSIVDHLAERWSAGPYRSKFDSNFLQTSHAEMTVYLQKPMTFMNLSGKSVAALQRFYKLPHARILVIHDELDLPFGTVRLKFGGGTAGHKGLSSVVSCTGSTDFARLRIGIGRPNKPAEDISAFVLSSFTGEEASTVYEVEQRAEAVVGHVVRQGIRDALNCWNSKRPLGSLPTKDAKDIEEKTS